jgi:ubiquitin-protein ligase E3 C
LAESRRTRWDAEVADSESDIARPCLVQQTRLLISFFSPKRPDDVRRLIDLSQRMSEVGYGPFLARQDIEPQIAPLSRVTLAALQA